MKRTCAKMLFYKKEVIFAQVLRLNRNLSMKKGTIYLRSSSVLNRREVHELVVGYFRVSEK